MEILPQVESLPGEYRIKVKPQEVIYNNTLYFLNIQASYAVDPGSITISFNNKEGLFVCESPICFGFVPVNLEAGKDSEISIFGITFPAKGSSPKFIFSMLLNIDEGAEKIGMSQFVYQGSEI